MRTPSARTAMVLAGAATLALGIAVAGGTASATPSTSIVISEVYGAGGNSGAVLNNDFVELQNLGSTAADLSGYSVQYHSSGSTGSWQVTPLTGSIPAHGHWLVQESGSTANGAPLPTADTTGSIAMAATAGTVALVHDTSALTCGLDCPTNSAVVDLVGYGTATIHEGAAAAPAPSATASDQRAADGTDTDNNGADFTTAAPTPTNSGSGGGGGGGDQPGPLRIHDIQGTTWLSPQTGNAVTNVPGIVTARQTGSGKGFWMQDPNPDANPATSEGVFVFTSSTPTVAVGDSVLVSGKVSEFRSVGSGETSSTTGNLSTTEIDSPVVDVLSSGNALPAPIVLGPDTVPDTYAPDLGGANIETTPITPSRSALDFYESVEGMRVEVDNARVVGPSDSFAETYITSKPDQDRTYRGGTELLGENQTPSGRLEVVALDGSNPNADVGDVLQGATVGPISWSSFGGYLIEATDLGTLQRSNLPPVVANPPAKRLLSIATYNVENLAPGDSDAKFAALGQGVVTNLASPDIVSLEEIQDNTGATDDGTVAADQTLDKLVAAIVAAGGPHYDYRQVNPVNDQDGGQPGGNIRVAFLYNPARVTFDDAGAAGVNRSVTGTQVVKSHGVPSLSLSPGRIDPTNPVWTASRKPLVGEFSFNGKTVFVIANHFDAKLGDQNADGRFQYPVQGSATQRAGQALVVHDFVNKILAVDKAADVVVLGDLNDYQFSPALRVLTTGTADASGPANLRDLITTLPVDQQYTYVFDGISQVLDHILVSPKVAGVVYQVVHVNSEYHNQVSDHDPQVVDLRP